MIAVAIIGILAGIAIANYSSYTARARQGEAKLALTSVYTLQETFHSEFGAFIDDFSAIGYQPEGIKRHYAIGWSSQTSADVVTGYVGGIDVYYYDYVNVPASWGLDDGGTPQCTVIVARTGLNAARSGTELNPQTFEVKARGVLRDGIPCDEWAIDHNKVLSNPIISL